MHSSLRTSCFFNLTQDEKIDLFRRRQGLRVEHVFRDYFGWLMLPLSAIAFVLTTLFIIVVYRAIKDRRVSRKCYILILNRAIGDLLSCVCALLVCGYVILAAEISRDMVILMETIFIGCFWSAMISYVALCVLKLYAVWKPFQYRKSFTMRRCIYLCVSSWIVFLIMVGITIGGSALVKVPFLNEWSGCKMETCVRTMYRYRNSVLVAVYFFTLFVFTSTVLLIRRAQRFTNSFKNRDSANSSMGGKIQRVRFPLWKLGLNVATFAGLHVFYVIWCIGLLLNNDQCFFQRNYPEMIRLLGIIKFTLVIRVLVDPIISFLTDFQLRRGALALVGLHRKVAPGGKFQKTTSSEFNSSIKDSSQKSITRDSRNSTVSTVA